MQNRSQRDSGGFGLFDPVPCITHARSRVYARTRTSDMTSYIARSMPTRSGAGRVRNPDLYNIIYIILRNSTTYYYSILYTLSYRNQDSEPACTWGGREWTAHIRSRANRTAQPSICKYHQSLIAVLGAHVATFRSRASLPLAFQQLRCATLRKAARQLAQQPPEAKKQ